MSATSTPLSKAIKARRATVLESYFISSQNSANSGPICLSDASPRKRAKFNSSASSSGSRFDEDCRTPARANMAVKLICPGGLPSNPNPHSTSICVESESDLVEVINVTDSEVPVANKTQKNVKVQKEFKGDKAREIAQFAKVFHMLQHGRPMLEYESMRELFTFLKMPHLSKKHWGDNSGWLMAEYLYAQVMQKAREVIHGGKFLSISVDEVTTVDNHAWISIHAYVVQDLYSYGNVQKVPL